MIFLAKKLTVKACPLQEGGDNIYNYLEDKAYNFTAWEFENGAILVVGKTTNDWFFDSREEIEANGTDQVIDVYEEEDATSEWTKEELLESIERSEQEFGYDAGKIKELVK